MVIVPRFLARAIIFLTDASLRSISGASPSSTASPSWVSSFAILFRRLVGAGKLRQPLLQSMLRLFERLLLVIGLGREILLQPFRCMRQGLFHFLRRGDDLDRGSQIATGAVGVAVASGEGKAHGALRQPFPLAAR